MLQASQRRLALRQSGASSGELPSRPQVPQVAQLPEQAQGQLRVHAPQRRVLGQPQEQQAQLQAQASRPQRARLALPPQASPPASLPPCPWRPFPPPQLLPQPPGRGNACAPVPRASGQSSSSASF